MHMKITDHITFTFKLVNKTGGQIHLPMMIFEPLSSILHIYHSDLSAPGNKEQSRIVKLEHKKVVA
jgi:hypothetical protein